MRHYIVEQWHIDLSTWKDKILDYEIEITSSEMMRDPWMRAWKDKILDYEIEILWRKSTDGSIDECLKR